MVTFEQIRIDPDKLREARGKLLLTHVADMVGVSKQSLHYYETGKARIPGDVLARLCRLYGVQITTLDTDAPVSSSEKNV